MQSKYIPDEWPCFFFIIKSEIIFLDQYKLRSVDRMCGIVTSNVSVLSNIMLPMLSLSFIDPKILYFLNKKIYFLTYLKK